MFSVILCGNLICEGYYVYHFCKTSQLWNLLSSAGQLACLSLLTWIPLPMATRQVLFQVLDWSKLYNIRDGINCIWCTWPSFEILFFRSLLFFSAIPWNVTETLELNSKGQGCRIEGKWNRWRTIWSNQIQCHIQKVQGQTWSLWGFLAIFVRFPGA